MSAFNKTVSRLIKSNFSRFFSLFAITFVGICFVTGVGGISPKVTDTINDYYNSTNVSDIIIKSKSETGFSKEDIDTISNLSYTDYVKGITSIDKLCKEDEYRYYFYSFDDNDKINKLEIKEGRLPTSDNECVVEEKSNTLKEVKIDETLTFSIDVTESYSISFDFKVVGIVKSPLLYSVDGDYSITDEEEYLDVVMYVDTTYFTSPYLVLPTTDIYLTLNNTANLDYFSQNYLDIVKTDKENIMSKDGFSEDDVAYLTLEENKSYATLDTLAKKVNLIAFIFPVFFILVVALVVLTTIKRLIAEERSIIGCYKSLGYSSFAITSKYLIFTLVSTTIGILLGLLVGAGVLPIIIFPAFETTFILPTMTSSINVTTGGYSALFMVIAIIGITLYEALKEINDKPANLFLLKAPKAGRKILLERIPALWKRIKFSLKSTFRNIFRYVGRFLMIVISVMGSTAITVAGFGLYDISKTNIEFNGHLIDVSQTLAMISFVIIIFALCLCALVVYNLTTMNIAEREREIATLKVLGYTNMEVDGYVIREIVMMSIFGTILGLPLGGLLLYLVFTLLQFGSINDVNWYSYLASAVLVIGFVIIINLLLTPKIHKVDMNDSLKSLD